MKYLKIVLLLFIIPMFAFITNNPGMKTSTDVVKFFNHNAKEGLETLQNKVGHQVGVQWNEFNSTPTFVTGKLTAPGYSSSSDKSVDGIRFLFENKELFGLREPDKELKLISDIKDEMGMTHIKYQQQVNGVKIFQGQLIVHFNSDGSIECVNGRYFPTPDMNNTPKIDNLSAIQIAKKSLSNYKSTGEAAELNIYSKGVKLLLVYAVSLPSYSNPMMTVFIDANTGEVIKIDDGIRYDGPAVGSGIALDGNVKTVHSYLYGGKYYMIDASLPMYVAPIESLKGIIRTYDAQNDTTGNGYMSATVVTDSNNDNNFNDTERMKAAVSAHHFTRETYQMYKSRFNRNSIDNAGMTMENVVHYGIKLNNAYWNGFFMTYGDGDGVVFSNLAGSFDVIAHEITHGVTQKTANLVYELQPGAMNENMSDVFAVIADSADWLVGEDVFTPGTPGDGLRSMQDPHNGYTQGHPNWLPAHMDEFVTLPNDPQNDHGGVHINCGILNKAFYNVASVIGRSKAGWIWYRSLTTYLTNNSQFVDLRNACLNSAKDLFGNGSTEYNIVASGFTAVGIESSGGQTYSLSYDDNDPYTGVYESDANWELAVRFTPPVPNVKVSNIKILLVGENNPYGNGRFTLKMYKADGNGSLPGTSILSPSTIVPQQAGWLSINLSNVNPNGDFYVSVKYDGYNQPLIGADPPPGNQRAYEYNNVSWYKLTSPYDYTLFMRATVVTLTSVFEIDTKVPQKFTIAQNYPNPFNPQTSFRYELPTPSYVRLDVYDISGRRVVTLVDNNQQPGTYEATWNGKNDDGVNVASGVYYYRIEVIDQFNSNNKHVEINKMLLIK
ncbi:MAG: M4 family metallopeptidase [Bacteroidota bacterium]|nr:M4 family metallopeptidase [Bacteroidota bacterium]